MRKCDSCGKLYQESKDVFCPHCGAVAQKQCTHGSSFDSKRYNRGEIYKSNNPHYQNTTYSHSSEPHAQREKYTYNEPEHASGGKGDFGDKIPQFNLPDFKKVLSNGKLVSIIIFVIVVAFNFITGLLSTNDSSVSSDSEVVTVYEDRGPFFAVINEAKIEMVDTDGDFKTFTLEISGMGFDEYLPENMQNDVLSGLMTEKILSEDTSVEMMICDFSNKIVEEESYDIALQDSYHYSGEQVDGKCKYEFSYSFDYDEIVHIVNGVSFYFDSGSYIIAELPFSAFSLSEDGEITYYTSYADSDTDWNTVFSECSNQQELNRDICIDFDAGE